MLRATFWSRKALWVIVLCASTLVLSFGCITGPRDLSKYPDPKNSQYKLPWKDGESRFCVQGNWGIVSHRTHGEFSYDFYMPVASVVRAARAGVVTQVVQKHTGNGTNKPNNKVIIRHNDGTRGAYLHIMKDGSLVKKGQRVKQGEAIARSGNVGRSMLPHLHFHVSKGGETIPVSFKDVSEDQGIPRMFKFYTSGNSFSP